jgi:hypothetical protein
MLKVIIQLVALAFLFATSTGKVLIASTNADGDPSSFHVTDAAAVSPVYIGSCSLAFTYSLNNQVGGQFDKFQCAHDQLNVLWNCELVKTKAVCTKNEICHSFRCEH